jgi:hypothetical protein
MWVDDLDRYQSAVRADPDARRPREPHRDLPAPAYTTALGARRLGMGAAILLVFFPCWSS